VRLALLSSLIQAVVIISLETRVYLMHKQEMAVIQDYASELPVSINTQKANIISAYHLVFIVSQIFQFMLCVDAVSSRG
jgi:hypothetical protein